MAPGDWKRKKRRQPAGGTEGGRRQAAPVPWVMPAAIGKVMVKVSHQPTTNASSHVRSSADNFFVRGKSCVITGISDLLWWKNIVEEVESSWTQPFFGALASIPQFGRWTPSILLLTHWSEKITVLVVQIMQTNYFLPQWLLVVDAISGGPRLLANRISFVKIWILKISQK